MNINIIKPVLPSIDEVLKDFSDCLESGMVTNGGKNVRNLEKRLHEYFGSKYEPMLFCNGEMALYNLIQAWKIKLGYSHNQSFKVIVPSFTFSGTINAIVANNLEPLFCDVDESLTVDALKCNYGELKDVKMMIPVSAYGNIPNLESIISFCKDNDIIIVMDNAPAFGAKRKGVFTCNYGVDTIYSLHASKVFNSMEGGLALSNDEEICEILKNLRDFGQYEKIRGNVSVPGLNSKMQEVSAIVGLRNLDRIDEILRLRKSVSDKFQSHFSKLQEKGFLKTMTVDESNYCPYLYFPITLKEEATAFCEYMSEKRISVRRYYTAVHILDFYRGKYNELDLSFTNEIKDRIVSLPIHTTMTDDQIDYVLKTVSEYFENE